MGAQNEMKAYRFHHYCVIIPPHLSLSFSSTLVRFVSPHSLNSDSPSPEPTGVFLYLNPTLNMYRIKQISLLMSPVSNKTAPLFSI